MNITQCTNHTFNVKIDGKYYSATIERLASFILGFHVNLRGQIKRRDGGAMHLPAVIDDKFTYAATPYGHYRDETAPVGCGCRTQLMLENITVPKGPWDRPIAFPENSEEVHELMQFIHFPTEILDLFAIFVGFEPAQGDEEQPFYVGAYRYRKEIVEKFEKRHHSLIAERINKCEIRSYAGLIKTKMLQAAVLIEKYGLQNSGVLKDSYLLAALEHLNAFNWAADGWIDGDLPNQFHLPSWQFPGVANITDPQGDGARVLQTVYCDVFAVVAKVLAKSMREASRLPAVNFSGNEYTQILHIAQLLNTWNDPIVQRFYPWVNNPLQDF